MVGGQGQGIFAGLGQVLAEYPVAFALAQHGDAGEHQAGIGEGLPVFLARAARIEAESAAQARRQRALDHGVGAEQLPVFLDPGEALFAVALQLQGAAPGEERQLGLFPVQAGRLPVVPGTEYLQRVQWVDLERRRHQDRTIERLRLADGALEGAAQGVQALAQGRQPAHAAPRVWRQYLICSAMYQWMICANSPSTKGASSPFSSAQRARSGASRRPARAPESPPRWP